MCLKPSIAEPAYAEFLLSSTSSSHRPAQTRFILFLLIIQSVASSILFLHLSFFVDAGYLFLDPSPSSRSAQPCCIDANRCSTLLDLDVPQVCSRVVSQSSRFVQVQYLPSPSQSPFLLIPGHLCRSSLPQPAVTLVRPSSAQPYLSGPTSAVGRNLPSPPALPYLLPSTFQRSLEMLQHRSSRPFTLQASLFTRPCTSTPRRFRRPPRLPKSSRRDGCNTAFGLAPVRSFINSSALLDHPRHSS